VAVLPLKCAIYKQMATEAPNDLILGRFRVVLHEIYGDRLERIVLFGSRARSDARTDSDHAIAVFPKTLSRQVDGTRQAGQAPRRFSRRDGILGLSCGVGNAPFSDIRRKRVQASDEGLQGRRRLAAASEISFAIPGDPDCPYSSTGVTRRPGARIKVS
jgi:hypothetical protein